MRKFSLLQFDCSLGEAHLVQQKKSNGLVIEVIMP